MTAQIFAISSCCKVRGPLEAFRFGDEGQDWRRTTSQYRVTVENSDNGKTFSTDYYMGRPRIKPTAFDVVLSWACDVQSTIDVDDFAAWAEEGDFISCWKSADDVRKAQEVYHSIVARRSAFLDFLGDVDMDTVLDEDALIELCEQS